MELVDNINTLLGDDLKKSLKNGSRLKIAASCFSIYAYEALKTELEKIESLEFIFTSPTFTTSEATDKVKKERREFHIPKADRERSLYGSEFEIQLRNQLTQRAIARECANWIKRKAIFRSNKTKAPMQQFAAIGSEDKQVVYNPLNGFTAVDLGYQKGNAVSNLITKFDDANFSATFLNLFDQIWNDNEKLADVTNEISEHIASVYQENSPERIYFLILYNIFNEFLEDLDEDVLPNDKTGYQDTLVWKKLFNFQKDAATGIINKLEKFNGCILADSVGLGKTFTALAVIKYYELRNRSVLVLCPKKLADNWLNYNRNLRTNIFSQDRFNYDVLCHTDLSRNSGISYGTDLNLINWGNYDLVVIDESHNFRNNDSFKDKETRYQRLMNKVIKQGVKTKVLMLSATPVNNRFLDLRNQLALAYEGDSASLTKHLKTSRSVEEIFRRAQAAFNRWSKLLPEDRTPQAILDELDFDFFELLDSVTIARSRKHIETFYDTTDIGKFPKRLPPISYRSPLTTRDDVLDFNQIFVELKRLKLAVYAPISYIQPSKLKKYEELYDTEVDGGKGKLRQVDRERSLQALMTTNLLKRLESSIYAFRLTLSSLQTTLKLVIEKIDAFIASGQADSVGDFTDLAANWDAEDDDIDLPNNFEIGGKIKISLADMDVVSWKQEMSGDLIIISALLASMHKISPKEDCKLQHLKQQVKQKMAQPINTGNKKVLIFSAFADTAEYLYNNLSQDLATTGVHTALVTGKSTPRSTLKKAYAFQELLTLFSPVSKEKALALPQEPAEIDVLIATDCISEGQNLQDCDYLINYDIHWNPVRIIQRFGRVDRIGSKNDVIQLMNYWPDISLDDYINLKERVENRMIIADVTATGDDNVLSAQANDIAYRKDQLRRLQTEVVELEDLKTGISITDLGLNDFRMDLLSYVKTNGDIASIPNGMHTVVPAQPQQGLKAGAIFTLRNRNNNVNINQHNRLHPYYLVYVGQDGKVINNHTEVKRLLDLIRSSCKGESNAIPSAYEVFNQKTADGKDMSLYSNLLNQAIRSMIEVKEEKDLDSLFSGGRTTAMVNKISGLNDFELVAFVVIQD